MRILLQEATQISLVRPDGALEFEARSSSKSTTQSLRISDEQVREINPR